MENINNKNHSSANGTSQTAVLVKNVFTRALQQIDLTRRSSHRHANIIVENRLVKWSERSVIYIP